MSWWFVLVIILIVVGLVYKALRNDDRSEETDEPEGESENSGETSIRIGDVVVRPRTEEEERIRELLKEATALKDADPDGVIDILRDAYALIASTNTAHTLETFLRLPLYLQKVGRSDEAWKEFNDLLDDGYPNMPSDEASWSGMRSSVLDKMRLFLQREKRFPESVQYGILSIISKIREQLGRAEHSEPDERLMRSGIPRIQERAIADAQHRYERHTTTAEHLQSKEYLNEQISKLLKRASLLEHHNEVLRIVHVWASCLPEVDDSEYQELISGLLDGKSVSAQD